jgi:hypothetical protein
MPDYGDPSVNLAYRSIVVHCKTPEDFEKFKSIINEPITDKTKYVWYK